MSYVGLDVKCCGSCSGSCGYRDVIQRPCHDELVHVNTSAFEDCMGSFTSDVEFA
jgi:hypothetical protein